MSNPFILMLLVLMSVTLNTTGQSLLKLGAGQNPLNLYLFSGLVAYGISTIFYVAILGKLNVSIVYPVVIGLTIISTTFAGVFLLKEQVSTLQWLGIGLMLSGISAIALGKVAAL
ncbi:small multidrug resistance protein [Leptothoe spongobia TAU-MAC 1115]|uniref:Small multidrug resistance protein n=1 Tax=Leptothoe spongobia TAU-MAC 1115 TaxID=1967444 RepID=A0A947DG23_9CYAN|nr:small multidrug resistance protein [Leptothoe spongobia TAU-MAC 1115]